MRRARTPFLLAVFMALAANGRARIVRHPNRTNCNPTKITRKDIRNFHKVDDELFRGARPECSGYQKLEALGVRTIIDLEGTPETFVRGCLANGGGDAGKMKFISFDISLLQTALTGVSEKQIDELFRQIAEAPKPLFVNCKFGEDRTGFVVALYRMKRGEMTFPEARKEALYYGFEPRLLGLNRTLNRYKDSQAIAALPAPDPSPAPADSVCRAD